jgi:hypothetical protein
MSQQQEQQLTAVHKLAKNESFLAFVFVLRLSASAKQVIPIGG